MNRTRLRRFSTGVRDLYRSLMAPSLLHRRTVIVAIVGFYLFEYFGHQSTNAALGMSIPAPATPFGRVDVLLPDCPNTVYQLPISWGDIAWAFWLIAASLIPAFLGWDAVAKILVGAGTALASLHLGAFSGLWSEKDLLGQEGGLTTCSLQKPLATRIIREGLRIQSDTTEQLVVGGAILLLLVASTGPSSKTQAGVVGWKRILAWVVGALGLLSIFTTWMQVKATQEVLPSSTRLPMVLPAFSLLVLGGLAILPSAPVRRFGRGAAVLALTLSWSQHSSVYSLEFVRDNNEFAWNSLRQFIPVNNAQELRELAILGHVDDVYSTITFGAGLLLLVALLVGWLYSDFRAMRAVDSGQEPGSTVTGEEKA